MKDEPQKVRITGVVSQLTMIIFLTQNPFEKKLFMSLIYKRSKPTFQAAKQRVSASAESHQLAAPCPAQPFTSLYVLFKNLPIPTETTVHGQVSSAKLTEKISHMVSISSSALNSLLLNSPI